MAQSFCDFESKAAERTALPNVSVQVAYAAVLGGNKPISLDEVASVGGTQVSFNHLRWVAHVDHRLSRIRLSEGGENQCDLDQKNSQQIEFHHRGRHRSRLLCSLNNDFQGLSVYLSYKPWLIGYAYASLLARRSALFQAIVWSRKTPPVSARCLPGRIGR